MLKKLLSSHPDIVPAALDFQSTSGPWARWFVELLSPTGDHGLPRQDRAHRPSQDLKVLLRVMLAEDPDLRPQSMAEIAASIQGSGNSRPGRHRPTHGGGSPSLRLVQRLQKRIWVWPPRGRLFLSAIRLFQLEDRERGERDLESYANRMPSPWPSSWLTIGSRQRQRVYRNVPRDRLSRRPEGYLLTSRQWLPWLEDPHLPV